MRRATLIAALGLILGACAWEMPPPEPDDTLRLPDGSAMKFALRVRNETPWKIGVFERRPLGREGMLAYRGIGVVGSRATAQFEVPCRRGRFIIGAEVAGAPSQQFPLVPLSEGSDYGDGASGVPVVFFGKLEGPTGPDDLCLLSGEEKQER